MANWGCNGGWRLVRNAADGNPLWDGTGWYDDTGMETPRRPTDVLDGRPSWRIV